MTGRTIKVGDFLTQEQAKRAIQLYVQLGGGKAFVDTITAELIEPNLAAINAKLGQENNARFLAYVIEYAMIHSSEYQ